MNRFVVIAALAFSVTAVAPATAQGNGYYAATPVAAPAQGKWVTRNTVWNCNGGTCTAAKSATRDKLLCELVVREVGALRSFRAGGADFDADTLAKCNARAK